MEASLLTAKIIEGGDGMKQYTKPTMTIAKFGSEDAFAAGGMYEYVDVDTSDPKGPVTIYKINSFTAVS